MTYTLDDRTVTVTLSCTPFEVTDPSGRRVQVRSCEVVLVGTVPQRAERVEVTLRGVAVRTDGTVGTRFAEVSVCPAPNVVPDPEDFFLPWTALPIGLQSAILGLPG